MTDKSFSDEGIAVATLALKTTHGFERVAIRLLCNFRLPVAEWLPTLVLLFATVAQVPDVSAADIREQPVPRNYVTAPDAPARQAQAAADFKSKGCVSCHTASDEKTMHENPGVPLVDQRGKKAVEAIGLLRIE